MVGTLCPVVTKMWYETLDVRCHSTETQASFRFLECTGVHIWGKFLWLSHLSRGWLQRREKMRSQYPQERLAAERV